MINPSPAHNAQMRNIWTTRLLTFTLWLLAAASATYWLIQTTARATPNSVLANATVAGQGKTQQLQPDSLAVAHGLGAVGDSAAAPQTDAAPAVDWNPSRFTLSGIVAQGSEKDGLVMISVDGKPAQILQVGATVEANVVVQALSRQSVTLANISKPDAPVLLTLKLGEKAAGQSANATPYLGAAAHNLPAAFAAPDAAVPFGTSAPPPQPPPAAAAQANAPEAAADSAGQDREDRRARIAERMEQRRAANANNPAPAAPAVPAKADTPAPRRSVLSDDSLYFSN